MGLTTRKYGLQVIENDALVVLCFKDLGMTMLDTLTHHGFRQRAATLGFKLTASQGHNMLHRAMGRVKYTGMPERIWSLTSMGLEYRAHVVSTLRTLTVTRFLGDLTPGI